MHAILNLHRCFGVLDVAVAVGIWDRKTSGRLVGAESESWGRQGEEAILNGFNGVVNNGVDGVDDFVDERLGGVGTLALRAAELEGRIPEGYIGSALLAGHLPVAPNLSSLKP